MPIIGRREEKKLLESYRASAKPEFLVVYGRRRVGKTYLIREYFEDKFAFQYTGRFGITAKEQLESFSFALNKYGSGKYPQATSWAVAFEHLIDLIEKLPASKKKVVFLDELPWMDTPRSGFLSALEHFWNSWGARRKDLLLIGCGSATTWLADKVFRNRGGLFNRVTRRMYLKPFTLGECEEYYAAEGIQFTRRQMLEAYMILGGIPYYLSLLDNSVSLTQNIDKLCFADKAILKDEFGMLYSSLFKMSERHESVVRALSTKLRGLTRNELIDASGLSNGGGITKILSELEQSDFVRSYSSFSKKRKSVVWQLIDPFSLFYLKFMDGNRFGDESFWSSYSEKGGHNAWSGYAFELVCLLHAASIKAALGISGINTEMSAWQGEAGGKAAQIDLVISRADGVINLCEMKYSKNDFTISKAYDEELRRKRSVFAASTKTRSALFQTIITTYGLTPGAYNENLQSLITMDSLF
jgi:predicted AAA+ superfamily ATPase